MTAHRRSAADRALPRASRIGRRMPRASGESLPAPMPSAWTDRDLAARVRASLHRPDADLRDDVIRRVVAEGGEGARSVKVAVDGGIVTLDGPVPERSTKLVLEAIVEAVPGVRGVDSRLCVDWIDSTPSAERAPDAPAEPEKGYLQSTRGSPTSTLKRTE